MKGIVHIYSTQKQTELSDYYCAYMVYAIAMFAVVHSKDSLPRKNNLLTSCLSLLNIIKTLLILIYKIPYYGIAMLLRLSKMLFTARKGNRPFLVDLATNP
jgi:hypothetical protein